MGQVEFGGPGNFFDGLGLGGRSNAGDGEADGDGGTDALVEEVGFEEDLAVGDGDHVGRNVGGNVAGLGLDDGEGGHGATTVVFVDAGGTFQQPGVKIEHVARIGFATGGALEEQGNLTVGYSLFRKVIEDDEGVLALVHEPFADRATGVGGEVLIDGGIGGRGADDDGVFHGPGVFEGLDDAGDVGLLLADGDVDAVERLVAGELALFGGFILLGLGNDSVHRDGGLAGGAVADDEFALTAADRDHGIDGHDAGLDGDGDGFTGNDPGGEFFDRILGIGNDRTFAIERFAEGIDNAPEEAFANRDGEEAASGADFVSSFDVLAGTEEHAANFGFFQVEGESVDAAGEFDHLIEHDVTEALDFGDAVADFTDNTDIGAGDGSFEAGDLGFEFLKDSRHDGKLGERWKGWF